MISSLALVDDPLRVGAAVLVSRSLDGVHWGDLTVRLGEPHWGPRQELDACDNTPRARSTGTATGVGRPGDGNRIKMSTSTDGGRPGGPAGTPAGERALPASAASPWCSPTAR